MNKKRWFGILGFWFSLIFIKLVSAATPEYYFERTIEWLKSGWAPFFAAVLGTSSFDEFLFAKVLVLFLIFCVVYMVLRRVEIFSTNNAVLIIVSVVVSILSVRFMGENEFITGVLLPYGVMGASITVFLPMLIYSLFVQTSVAGTLGRRIAWIVYGIIFLVMWGMRGSEIGAVNYIYLAGIIFVILNFIFDGPIHQYFGTAPLRKARRDFYAEQRAYFIKKLKELEENQDSYNRADFERLKRKYQKKIKYYSR